MEMSRRYAGCSRLVDSSTFCLFARHHHHHHYQDIVIVSPGGEKPKCRQQPTRRELRSPQHVMTFVREFSVTYRLTISLCEHDIPALAAFCRARDFVRSPTRDIVISCAADSLFIHKHMSTITDTTITTTTATIIISDAVLQTKFLALRRFEDKQ